MAFDDELARLGVRYVGRFDQEPPLMQMRSLTRRQILQRLRRALREDQPISATREYPLPSEVEG